MLPTAQPVGFFGTECRRNGAIRPGQPPLRGLVDRTERGRRDRQNAALALHQDIARISGGGGDEGNPAGSPRGHLLANPLRQGARFSKAAAREQQPNLPPLARWRKLVWPCDRWPAVLQRIDELRSKGISHRSELLHCDDLRGIVSRRSSRRDRAMPQARPVALPDIAPPRSRSVRSLSNNRD